MRQPRGTATLLDRGGDCSAVVDQRLLLELVDLGDAGGRRRGRRAAGVEHGAAA